MSHSRTRVVITGLGVVSPLGRDLATFQTALKNRISGITEYTLLPVDGLTVKHGGQAKCFTGEIEDFGPLDKQLQRAIKKSQKVMCREIELGVAACQLALHHANLPVDQRNPDRCGIAYGCDYILTRPEEYADGLAACQKEGNLELPETWPTIGMPKVNPLWLLKYLPNMPASHVAILNDLRGPSNSLTVREASNALTIGEATAAIRRGAADMMVVGATGSRIEPLRFVQVSKQERVARDRTPPSAMPRPFESDRDGVVLGEGSAAFVLESLEHAQRRGAIIYAEVISSTSSTVGPKDARDHIRLAIKNVLGNLMEQSKSTLSASKWHLHASGHGDPKNDISEALGIYDCLGDAIQPPIVAAQSYFGSLGAGGAAVEFAASCLSLLSGELFPTLNQDKPDPRCPIRVSSEPTDAGSAFIHLAYSPQGQAAGVCIAKFI
jgi:3-oxoacyl-[acyl-carrier-protein] synthase II